MKYALLAALLGTGGYVAVHTQGAAVFEHTDANGNRISIVNTPHLPGGLSLPDIAAAPSAIGDHAFPWPAIGGAGTRVVIGPSSIDLHSD